MVPKVHRPSSIGEKYFHPWRGKELFSTHLLDLAIIGQITQAYQKLNDWQNQSPGTSFELHIFESFSRLSRSEFQFLAALGFLTKDRGVRATVLQILDENQRGQCGQDLCLITDLRRLAKQPKLLDRYFLEMEVFPFFSLRRMKGLLCDPILKRKFQNRLKTIRPRRRRKPSTGARIRGYRDHGHLPSVSEVARREANKAGSTREVIEEFLLDQYLQNLQSDDPFVRLSAFRFYQSSLANLAQKYGDS